MALAEEVGTSPTSKRCALDKALAFWEDKEAFGGDKVCRGCCPSAAMLVVQGGLSPETPLWPHGQ